jgi:hypothetical protein
MRQGSIIHTWPIWLHHLLPTLDAIHLPLITDVAYCCMLGQGTMCEMNDRYILIQYVCPDRFALLCITLLYHSFANPSLGGRSCRP